VVLPHYSNQFKLEPAKQLIYAPQPALHWQSSAAYLSPSQWQATFYGYDYKEHVNYTKADSKTAVRLDIYGYKQQDQGKELISDTHFVASRLFWRVTLPSPIVVNGIKIQPQVVHDKTGKRLVWHWYNVAGLSTSNKRFAKIYELVNFTLAEKQASAVILISSTCRSNCLKASERLTAATSELNLLNL
jgi:EpsI family protein